MEDPAEGADVRRPRILVLELLGHDLRRLTDGFDAAGQRLQPVRTSARRVPGHDEERLLEPVQRLDGLGDLQSIPVSVPRGRPPTHPPAILGPPPPTPP